MNLGNSCYSSLPVHQELQSNLFTQILDVADKMFASAERMCTWIIIFLVIFNSREGDVCQEIVQKLQALLAIYEELQKRYSEVLHTDSSLRSVTTSRCCVAVLLSRRVSTSLHNWLTRLFIVLLIICKDRI